MSREAKDIEFDGSTLPEGCIEPSATSTSVTTGAWNSTLPYGSSNASGPPRT